MSNVLIFVENKKKSVKIFFPLFKALLKYLTTAKSDSLFYVISRYAPTRLGMSGTAS